MAEIAQIYARVVTVVFGMASLLWAFNAFQISVRSAAGEGIATRIVSGEPFKDEVLTASLAGARPPAVPSAVYARTEAFVRLRAAEASFDAADSVSLDRRLTAARRSVDAVLFLSPADSFFWMAKFWLENTQDGFQQGNVKYLAYSYKLGPREGWFAQRRNRFALSIFAELDSVTQESVVAEFAGMVASNLILEAAFNLAGPGWNHRDQLLAGLADVGATPKETLRRILGREGIRISIPSLPERDERPWQ